MSKHCQKQLSTYLNSLCLDTPWNSIIQWPVWLYHGDHIRVSGISLTVPYAASCKYQMSQKLILLTSFHNVPRTESWKNLCTYKFPVSAVNFIDLLWEPQHHHLQLNLSIEHEFSDPLPPSKCIALLTTWSEPTRQNCNSPQGVPTHQLLHLWNWLWRHPELHVKLHSNGGGVEYSQIKQLLYQCNCFSVVG